MTTEEDKELRELVVQTLEKKGVLAKVQAEIRASVFIALEENDVFKDKSPFINDRLKEYTKTSEGTLVVSLVKEFLEFFNLQFTTMVFDPETHAGVDYKYNGRSALANELKLNSDEGKGVPLLGKLIPLLKINEANSSGKHISQKDTVNSTQEVKSTVVLGNDQLTNESSANKGESGFIFKTEKNISDKKNSSFTGISAIQVQNNADLSTKSLKPSSLSGLSSLGGLPPITGLLNQNKEEYENKEKRTVTRELKDILDLGLGEIQYDEDVNSSQSEKIKKASKSGSDVEGSEIEEEISTHSNESPNADEGTIDCSVVTEVAGHADYIEDV